MRDKDTVLWEMHKNRQKHERYPKSMRDASFWGENDDKRMRDALSNFISHYIIYWFTINYTNQWEYER